MSDGFTRAAVSGDQRVGACAGLLRRAGVSMVVYSEAESGRSAPVAGPDDGGVENVRAVEPAAYDGGVPFGDDPAYWATSGEGYPTLTQVPGASGEIVYRPDDCVMGGDCPSG